MLKGGWKRCAGKRKHRQRQDGMSEATWVSPYYWCVRVSCARGLASKPGEWVTTGTRLCGRKGRSRSHRGDVTGRSRSHHGRIPGRSGHPSWSCRTQLHHAYHCDVPGRSGTIRGHVSGRSGTSMARVAGRSGAIHCDVPGRSGTHRGHDPDRSATIDGTVSGRSGTHHHDITHLLR